MGSMKFGVIISDDLESVDKSIEFEVRINDDLESVDKSMRSLGCILSSVRKFGLNIDYLGKDKFEWSTFKVEGSNEKLDSFIGYYGKYFDLGQYD